MASPSSISDDSEEESIISYYFLRGYTYEVIRGFLATFHSITTCGRQGGVMISARFSNIIGRLFVVPRLIFNFIKELTEKNEKSSRLLT